MQGGGGGATDGQRGGQVEIVVEWVGERDGAVDAWTGGGLVGPYRGSVVDGWRGRWKRKGWRLKGCGNGRVVKVARKGTSWAV